MNKYLKAEWNESRGDEYDSWGTSIWLFELDDENYPVRQIEIYQNGKKLKYDLSKKEDEFGALGDQPMYKDEMDGTELSSSEFEAEWVSE